MLHIEPTKTTMKSIAACAIFVSTRGRFGFKVKALNDVKRRSAA